MAKLDHDRTDCESEAARASRASEVDDSASPSEDSQSVHVDPVVGTKRRASAVSALFNAARRQRPARTKKEVSDYAHAQRNAETCLTEIPDSQTDAEHGGLEATQEAHSEDIDSATSRDEQESEPSRRLGTLLLWDIEEESLSSESYAAFAQLIISQRLDVTFDEARFWSRVSERSDLTPMDGGAYQRHLALVGGNAQSVAIRAASFMLSALQHHRSVLDTCPPCGVDFIEWDMVVHLCLRNAAFSDLWGMDSSTYLTVAYGNVRISLRATCRTGIG